MKQKIIVTFQGGEQASARSPCGGIDGGTGFTEYFQWVPEEGSMQWSPQVSKLFEASNLLSRQWVHKQILEELGRDETLTSKSNSWGCWG